MSTQSFDLESSCSLGVRAIGWEEEEEQGWKTITPVDRLVLADHGWRP